MSFKNLNLNQESLGATLSNSPNVGQEQELSNKVAIFLKDILLISDNKSYRL